jgi:hypothetical protein
VFNEVPSELYCHGDGTLKDPKKYNLEFMSEYTREENRFRGHWDYRSNGPWNDWACINCGDVEGLVPANILMVAKYTKPSFMPEEDPSCDPWVYEAINVLGLTRPLVANTLLKDTT